MIIVPTIKSENLSKQLAYARNQTQSYQISSKIADAIKNYRTQANMSQNDLAQLLGVSEETIINYEIGMYNFKISELVHLSNKTNILFDISIQSKSKQNQYDTNAVEWKNKNIRDLPIFSTRIKNALIRANITTLYALSKQTIESLSHIDNIGILSISEICNISKTIGINIQSQDKTPFHPIIFKNYNYETLYDYLIKTINPDSFIKQPYMDTFLNDFCKAHSIYTKEEITEYIISKK